MCPFRAPSTRRNATAHKEKRSPFTIHYSLLTIRPAGREAFTLIEMLVVIGIIILVAAISLPLLTAMTRGGKLRHAEDMAKSACLAARGRAIRERRKISVTFLEFEREIIVTDYDMIRRMLPLVEEGKGQATGASDPDTFVRETATDERDDCYLTLTKPDSKGYGEQGLIASHSGTRLNLADTWSHREGWSRPTGPTDEEYVIGEPPHDYVWPHLLANYDVDGTYTTDEQRRNKRHEFLKTMTVERIRTLPEGCNFDLDDDEATYDHTNPSNHGWTYVFLPTGGVWTVNTDATDAAENEQNDKLETTYLDAHDKPAGPRIYGPRDETWARVIVYAMTGQALTE